MGTTKQEELVSIAEYLGCNEGEFVSEVSRLINSEVLSVLEEIDKENERCGSGCWVTIQSIKNRYKL